jgi:hypothetical protein
VTLLAFPSPPQPRRQRAFTLTVYPLHGQAWRFGAIAPSSSDALIRAMHACPLGSAITVQPVRR